MHPMGKTWPCGKRRTRSLHGTEALKTKQRGFDNTKEESNSRSAPFYAADGYPPRCKLLQIRSLTHKWLDISILGHSLYVGTGASELYAEEVVLLIEADSLINKLLTGVTHTIAALMSAMSSS